MQILIRVVISILAIVAVAAIGLIAYLNLADLSAYETDVEEGLSDVLGHQVEIEGPFNLTFGRQLRLTAENLALTNPDWPGAGEYLRVGRLHLDIDTWSLLDGPLTVNLLDLDNIRATLEKSASGEANWTPAPVQVDADEGTSDDSLALIINKLDADTVTASLSIDGGAPQQLDIDVLRLLRGADGRTAVSGELTISAGEFSLPLQIDTTFKLDNARVTIGELGLDSTGISADLSGWLEPGGAAPGGTLSTSIEGPDLAAFAASLGAGGLPEEAFAVSFDTVLQPGGVEIHDLIARIGDGLLNGSMAVETSGERPSVVANLHAPKLDLRSAAATDDGADETSRQSDEPARLFSDEPLASSSLRALDLEAEVFFQELLLNADRWSDVNAKVTLRDGSLAIEPFGLNSGDGQLNGRVSLQPQGQGYVLEAEILASNFRFGALATDEGGLDAIPPLALEANLAGTGDSIHAIMSTANGRLSGRQERGQLNMQAAGFLFSDLVTSVLRTINPLADSDPITTLECGVYEIEIVDGIATIDELALQTQKLTIVSSGTVDFETEQIDMALRTKTREGLGVSVGGVVNSFLKIGGTLREPSVGVDAAGSVTTTGAAVATGGLSLLARGLWDRVSAEADICAREDDQRPASE